MGYFNVWAEGKPRQLGRWKKIYRVVMMYCIENYFDSVDMFKARILKGREAAAGNHHLENETEENLYYNNFQGIPNH